MKNSSCFYSCSDRNMMRKEPASTCCYDQGYIVEKIVHRKSESLCFEGFLPLNNLTDRLCPPLTLCGIEVLQIRPCKRNVCSCERELLEITLLCLITDARGCRGQGFATIEVESCDNNWPCSQSGLNLRRGAEICIGFSRFCAPCGFEVSLRIALQTILSRCEITSSRPHCDNPCPPALPLYPPPIRRFH